MKILYICNFRNVHARAFVEHFAARSDYAVTVVSTFAAEPMPGVRLIAPTSAVGDPRKAALKGRLAGLIYRFFAAAPELLVRVRNLEMLYQVRTARRLIERALDQVGTDFDLVHAFRTQPEGLAAVAARARTGRPLFLTTYGQDFVLFARRSAIMSRSVRRAMAQVDVLLADNPRDERMAREEFGLRPDAISRVYPANGGLDTDLLRAAESRPAPALRGEPALLSMRGYENAYIRVRVLLEALREFRRSAPGAHLYIDVNAVRRDPARDELMQSWIDELELRDHVTVLHLDRAGVFAHMRAAHAYVSATISDGLPMSLLEALWFGQVTVTADHESTRDVIAATDGSFTFDRMEPERIAAAWTEALATGRSREQRRAANQTVLEDSCSRAAVMHRIERLYAEVARRD